MLYKEKGMYVKDSSKMREYTVEIIVEPKEQDGAHRRAFTKQIAKTPLEAVRIVCMYLEDTYRDFIVSHKDMVAEVDEFDRVLIRNSEGIGFQVFEV